MKHEGAPFIDDGVPRVRPSLVTNHRVDIAGQDIHDLALAFIAPLRPDHHKISHRLPCSQKKSPGWTESQSRGAMVGAPLEFVKNRANQIFSFFALKDSLRSHSQTANYSVRYMIQKEGLRAHLHCVQVRHRVP